ncbi:MAG: YihY/virulence factor BrkB family protein [Actinomycetota bacterium]
MSDRPPLRERLEAPIERAVELKDRTLATFPVRVWRNFLLNNGFLLSAGMSYYVLFALFALLYIAFAAAGLWLGASEQAIDALIAVMNTYIPGIIGDDGLFRPQDVTDIAKGASGVLGITGIIASGVGVWTAIGAVTFTRRAVRDSFGLPFDPRNYWLLKIKDFFAAAIFGGAMLLGAGISWAGVWALEQAFHLLGWSTGSWLFSVSVRALSVAVLLALDVGAIALLVRFLTGTSLRWRFIGVGALLGGAAVTVLQLGAGLLLSRVPANPLLASFAVIVGLLLWCRWLAIVVLVASSWIAVTAEDHDQPLEHADEAAARRAEHEALVLAARVQVRRAHEAQADAPWYRRPSAARAVRSAEKALEDAETDAASDDVRGPA